MKGIDGNDVDRAACEGLPNITRCSRRLLVIQQKMTGALSNVIINYLHFLTEMEQRPWRDIKFIPGTNNVILYICKNNTSLKHFSQTYLMKVSTSEIFSQGIYSILKIV